METNLQKLLEMRKKQLDAQEKLIEIDGLEMKSNCKDTKSPKRKALTKNTASVPSKIVKTKRAKSQKVGSAKKVSPKKDATGKEIHTSEDGESSKSVKSKVDADPQLQNFNINEDHNEQIVQANNSSKVKKPKNTKQSTRKATVKPKKVFNKQKANTKEINDFSTNSMPEIKTTITEDDFSCHSFIQGQKLFAWLLNPIDLNDFFANTWETKPLLVDRIIPEYYENVISTEQIDNILRFQRLDYTKNIDITSYENGVRETHNPTGRALAPVVWDFYLNGCSVRLLNPQAYIPKIHLLCATLQEFFGCMVGANSYLTPPGSQGFAPHYDDIEAFVLQVEGKKHWKLYSPRNPSEVLPRISSLNFKREELGESIMDVVLKPGDLLYFPRGTIHEANTLENDYSLHVTISVYQKHSWADLIEKVVPAMVSRAISENVIFRKGLPLDLPNCLGLVHSDDTSPRRQELLKRIKELIIKTIDYAPLDAAVDQICKEFQHSALPPAINSQEMCCTAFGDGEIMAEKGVIKRRVEIAPDTKIRLIRANILRMLLEENIIRVYYSIDNTKEYHEIEPQYMDVDEAQAAAIEYLLASYPSFITIVELPMDLIEDKVTLVQNLWEKGLLVTDKPLPTKD